MAALTWSKSTLSSMSPTDPGEEPNALVAARHGEGADVGGVDVDLGAGHVLDGGHHGLVVLLHEVLAALNIQLGQNLLGSQIAELTKMKMKYFFKQLFSHPLEILQAEVV